MATEGLRIRNELEAFHGFLDLFFSYRRNLHVTWELTVSDNSGQNTVHGLSWARFCGTCVTVCWTGGGRLPDLQQISSLRLHGVRRIPLRCPGLQQ